MIKASIDNPDNISVTTNNQKPPDLSGGFQSRCSADI